MEVCPLTIVYLPALLEGKTQSKTDPGIAGTEKFTRESVVGEIQSLPARSEIGPGFAGLIFAVKLSGWLMAHPEAVATTEIVTGCVPAVTVTCRAFWEVLNVHPALVGEKDHV